MPQGSEGDAEARPQLGPLPGGHHGFSAQQVADSQRERLLAAAGHVIAERGFSETRITEIVSVASVSSRAFYENFDSKEDAFIAALEAIFAHLEALLREVVRPFPDWPQKFTAALRAALQFFDAEPELARLCLVESLTATPAITARVREAVLACIPLLALGRGELAADSEPLAESTEDSVLGSLLMFTSRSVASRPGALIDLLPDLLEFALSPYLGPTRAKQFAEASHDGP